MLYQDDSTKLLDMEHMHLKGIEIYSDRLILHVEMKRRPTPCSCCDTLIDTIHDYREQKVQDSLIQGKAVYWIYRNFNNLRQRILLSFNTS